MARGRLPRSEALGPAALALAGATSLWVNPSKRALSPETGSFMRMKPLFSRERALFAALAPADTSKVPSRQVAPRHRWPALVTQGYFGLPTPRPSLRINGQGSPAVGRPVLFWARIRAGGFASEPMCLEPVSINSESGSMAQNCARKQTLTRITHM